MRNIRIVADSSANVLELGDVPYAVAPAALAGKA